MSGDGTTAANAITFESGTNSLTLLSGSTVTGNVVGDGSADALKLGGSVNGSFDVSTIGASAQFRGFESLAKIGASTWTLAGSNSQAWNAQAGTLLVDGSASIGSVIVDAGATFGGTGSAGDLLVAGTLTAATMTTAGSLSSGDLTFQSTGIFSVQIGGTGLGQYDQVAVTGTVSLGGADLSASFVNTFTANYRPSTGDIFRLIANDGADAVTGNFNGLAEGGTVTFSGRVLRITYQGGDGNDVVLTDTTPAVVDGGAPPPPPPPPIRIDGTDGDDTNLTGNEAGNVIRGHQGNDVVRGLGGADIIYGNQGADLIYGNLGQDSLYGGQGADTMFGGQDADLEFGGIGADVVYGNRGDDVIYGNQDADRMYGGQGNDALYGGQGNDLLFGNMGDDTLVGGLGADRYVFGRQSGSDLIIGFSQSQGDRLDFGGQSFTLADDGHGGTLFTLSSGGTVQLQGVQHDQVTQGFFA